MSQLVEIELPDELPAALQRDAAQLGGEVRLTTAVKWDKQGRLNQGKAAEVAAGRQQALKGAAAAQIELLPGLQTELSLE